MQDFGVKFLRFLIASSIAVGITLITLFSFRVASVGGATRSDVLLNVVLPVVVAGVGIAIWERPRREKQQSDRLIKLMAWLYGNPFPDGARSDVPIDFETQVEAGRRCSE